jgi:hypothetical protein
MTDDSSTELIEDILWATPSPQKKGWFDELIKKEGHSVSYYDDATKAYETYITFPPKVVLVDILFLSSGENERLKEFDENGGCWSVSAGLIKMMKEYNPSIPIISIGGYSVHGQISDIMFDAGIDDHICTKTYNPKIEPEVIVEKVKSYISND